MLPAPDPPSANEIVDPVGAEPFQPLPNVTLEPLTEFKFNVAPGDTVTPVPAPIGFRPPTPVAAPKALPLLALTPSPKLSMPLESTTGPVKLFAESNVTGAAPELTKFKPPEPVIPMVPLAFENV